MFSGSELTSVVLVVAANYHISVRQTISEENFGSSLLLAQKEEIQAILFGG